MNLKVKDVKLYNKNTLKAFFTLELADYGVELRDCTWHSKGNSEWIDYASKPFIGDDDKLKRDETGKAIYKRIVYVADNARRAIINNEVLKLLKADTDPVKEPLEFPTSIPEGMF